MEIIATEPDISPSELAKNSALNALFNFLIETPLDKHLSTKRNCSSHTIESGDEARAKKRVRKRLQRDRRAFFVDDELL